MPYSKLVTRRLLLTQHMNLFLSVISLDKCPLSNYQYNPPLPNSPQIQVWGFASQIYKTSFSKNGFKTQIYKTRFAILIREIYKAVIVQSLKFTQKVTVNHMLPFPSALYTFVILVYNKQTKNKQTLCKQCRPLYSAIYVMTIMYSPGRRWEKNEIKSATTPTKNPSTPKLPQMPPTAPTVQSTEIWDCPKSEFQAHPATDIWISIQIHSCSCHPSLKELKKTKLDML